MWLIQSCLLGLFFTWHQSLPPVTLMWFSWYSQPVLAPREPIECYSYVCGRSSMFKRPGFGMRRLPCVITWWLKANSKSRKWSLSAGTMLTVGKPSRGSHTYSVPGKGCSVSRQGGQGRSKDIYEQVALTCSHDAAQSLLPPEEDKKWLLQTVLKKTSFKLWLVPCGQSTWCCINFSTKLSPNPRNIGIQRPNWNAWITVFIKSMETASENEAKGKYAAN